jgi:hypothetical protein
MRPFPRPHLRLGLRRPLACSPRTSRFETQPWPARRRPVRETSNGQSRDPGRRREDGADGSHRGKAEAWQEKENGRYRSRYSRFVLRYPRFPLILSKR